MEDLLFIGATIAFFAVCFILIHFFDLLLRGES